MPHMTAIRRYLRISRDAALECRIYLEKPGATESWLLNPRNDVLPRVVEAIRPLVLPKLREERERERRGLGNKKKKCIRDVVVEDDFEVSLFLAPTKNRHSVLTVHRHFYEQPSKPRSESSMLPTNAHGWGTTGRAPIDLDAEPHVRIRQEDDDEPVVLDDLPTFGESAGPPRRSKRTRNASGTDGADAESTTDGGDAGSATEISDDEAAPSRPKRPRTGTAPRKDGDGDDSEDDKKRMAAHVSYEGFAVYGRILFLVIKKREPKRVGTARGGGPRERGVMENWIISTQLEPEDEGEEEAVEER